MRGRRLRLSTCARLALLLLGTIVAALTLAGFAGRLHRLAELASHFRVQYFLGLGVAAVALALMRRRWPAAVFAAFAVANLVVIAPLYIPPDPPAAGPRRTVRLMHANVRTSNRQTDRLLAAVREVDPDLVALAETSDRWIDALGELKRSHPHFIARARPDNFGIALFSRLPLREARVVLIGRARVPSIVARVEAGDAAFTLFVTHPLPPSGPGCFELRNEQFAAMAEFLKQAEPPVVLVGDLNVTPWSPYFRSLVRQTGLRDSERGFGVQPSWPRRAFWFRIPIDHCLHAQDIVVTNRRIGSSVGSDHFPLIVELGVPVKRAPSVR